MQRHGQREKSRSPCLSCVFLLAIGLLASGIADAQEPSSEPEIPAARTSRLRHSVESKLTFEGQGSFGNHQIFAAGEHSRLFTAGKEYDVTPGAIFWARRWTMSRSFSRSCCRISRRT